MKFYYHDIYIHVLTICWKVFAFLFRDAELRLFLIKFMKASEDMNKQKRKLFKLC